MNGRIGWQAPSNIALIKYWGKKENQLPQNPSLSMTLHKANTVTWMDYEKTGNFSCEFLFEEKRNDPFEKRVQEFLEKNKDYFPFIKDFSLKFHSTNTFPHSVGIASSASSMASVALCLRQLKNDEEENFFREASQWARLASGSACRSIYGGFVEWGGSFETWATPLPVIHPIFHHLCDTILVVDSSPKKISSSQGHKLMENHADAPARYQNARRNFEIMQKVLISGDWDTFASVVEQEAMELHKLIMTSGGNPCLWHPHTMVILEKIKRWREEMKLPLTFTLDAGPNIHLLFPPALKEQVHAWIEMNVSSFLESYIEDYLGTGPKKL